MELRHLEAFAATMSTGSVTGSARLLGRSQPAVSRLLQELELEIGYSLFSRNGPRVTPTDHGFLLYDDVERVLGGMRQIHLRAKEISRGDVQPLLITTTSAVAVGLLPAAIRHAEEITGTRPIQLRSASPEEVVRSVLTGAVHLGVSSLPLEHRGLDVLWIGQLPCLAALAASDPLATLAVVPLAKLAERRIVTMSNPYRLRQRLNLEWARAGLALPGGSNLIETNSSVNALALVRDGLGVAVLEPLTARGLPVDGVVLRPLDVDIPFHFGVVCPNSSRPLAPATLAMVDALLAAATQLPGFVQHDPSSHASLLQSLQGDTAKA